jgi:hypothetical protein
MVFGKVLLYISTSLNGSDVNMFYPLLREINENGWETDQADLATDEPTPTLDEVENAIRKIKLTKRWEQILSRQN